MSQIPKLFELTEAYCAKTGLSEARVSTLVLKGGSRLKQLREGKDIGVRILDRAIQWFSDHWPENGVWPEGVDRPSPKALPDQPLKQAS